MPPLDIHCTINNPCNEFFQHGILATSEGYLLIEPSAVPVMEEEEEEKEMKKQSHLVSRHKPLLHSEDTCSTTHLGKPL